MATIRKDLGDTREPSMGDSIEPQQSPNIVNRRPIEALMDEDSRIWVYMDVTHCSSAGHEYRLVPCDLKLRSALLTIRDQCDTLAEAKKLAADALK